MLRLVSLLGLAVSLPFGSAGQSSKVDVDRAFSCGTENKPQNIAAILEANEAGVIQTTRSLHGRNVLTGRDISYPWGKVTVKTWIHVVAESQNISDGWMPDSQIDAQFAYLNEHFAPTNFQFQLEGVTRTINADWANDVYNETVWAELDMKKALRRGDYATLNLYFLKRLYDDYLGYAYFPTKVDRGSDDFYLDGSTQNSATVPGGSYTRYNLDGTVVHEVGHWFGLLHTFGSPEQVCNGQNCTWVYNCNNPQDHIADTPAQLGPTRGCPVGRDSCPDLPGLDPIHNWMDYSDDICYDEFTPLQIKRMWDNWFQYRAPRTCNADNCLRALRANTVPGRLEESQNFCSEITQTIVTEVSAFKKYAVDACSGNVASRVSSACSCLPSTASANSMPV